jgi:aquaporin Z
MSGGVVAGFVFSLLGGRSDQSAAALADGHSEAV